MAPESVQQLERVGAAAPAAEAPRHSPLAAHAATQRAQAQHSEGRIEPRTDTRMDTADGRAPGTAPGRRRRGPGRRSAADEHAVVPGLRARTHAQAPPGRAGSRAEQRRAAPAGGVVDRVGTRPHGGPACARSAGPPRAAGAARGDPRAGCRCCCAHGRRAWRPGREPGARAGRRALCCQHPRPDRDDGRAALDARPDRAALRRTGLHGKAAAPAAPGHADAEAAGRRLVAVADPQAGRKPARPRSTRRPGPPACWNATCSPANASRRWRSRAASTR